MAEDDGEVGDNIVEDLWSKRGVIDKKMYFFDLRSNSRGMYLKVTEVLPSKKRNTVVLPGNVMQIIRTIVNDGIAGKLELEEGTPDEDLEGRGVVIISKFIDTSQKKYFMDLVQNTRGRYLKIAEVQTSRGRSVVVLPESGWLQVKRILDELNKTVPSFAKSVPLERVGIRKDAANKEPRRPKRKNNHNRRKNDEKEQVETQDDDEKEEQVEQENSAVEDTNDLVDDEQVVLEEPKKKINHNAENGEQQDDEASNKIKKTLVTRTMKTPLKRYFFDLQENSYGRYLKVAQLVKGTRDTVILPKTLWVPLSQLFDAYIENDFERTIENLEVMLPPAKKDDNEEDNNVNGGGDNNKKRPRTKIICGRSFKTSNRLYFMDLRENSHGRFLRLSEVSKTQRRVSVSIPDSCFTGFKQALDEFHAYE